MKTFDYDGQKYRSKDAATLITKLDEEIKILTQKLLQNDIEIYRFFYTQALKKGKENDLKKMYLDFFNLDTAYETKTALYQTLIQSTNFISEVTPFDEIEKNFTAIATQEISLKKEIRLLLDDSDVEAEITKIMKDNFEKYVSQEWVYFYKETYYDESLQVFFAALNDYHYVWSRKYFLAQIHLLNYQVTLLEN